VTISWIRTNLRDAWYLVLAVAVLFGLAAYKHATEEHAPEQTASAAVRSTRPDIQQTSRQPRPAARRLTEQDKAQAIIADYQQRLDEEPRGEDAPVLLHAMGNLARQKLGDYAQAAQCYEVILTEFPEWEGIRKVYPQLATCYERLGQTSEEHKVYRRMMKALPEDSQEYAFAKQQLGIP